MTKKTILDENVLYEIHMMNYCFYRYKKIVHRPNLTCKFDELLERNAFLESFILHYRNVRDFLKSKSKNNTHYAKQYLSGFNPVGGEKIASIYKKVHPQIMHISEDRGENEKISYEDIFFLFCWAKNNIIRFKEMSGLDFDFIDFSNPNKEWAVTADAIPGASSQPIFSIASSTPDQSS